MSLDNGSMDSSLLNEDVEVDLLHDIGSRPGAADPVHDVLARLVDFVSALVKCDCCLIYVLEGDELVLRASKTPHPEVVDRLKLRMGQGITGWVAEHKEPVSVTQNAAQDQRFRLFNELPEDSYEAFLSVPLFSRGNLVGVINLQHRRPHVHTRRQIRLIATAGFLRRSGVYGLVWRDEIQAHPKLWHPKLWQLHRHDKSLTLFDHLVC